MSLYRVSSAAPSSLILASRHVRVSSAEGAALEFDEPDIDPKAWQPEYYYARRIWHTEKVIHAARSWIAVRDALPLVSPRHATLEALRISIYNSLNGMDFSARPTATDEDMEKVRRQHRMADDSRGFVPLGTSLSFAWERDPDPADCVYACSPGGDV